MQGLDIGVVVVCILTAGTYLLKQWRKRFHKPKACGGACDCLTQKKSSF